MKSPLLSLGLVSFLLPAHLVGAVGSDYNLSNGRAKARDPLPLYYDEPSEPYYDAPPPPYYYDSSTKSIATSMSGYYIPLSEAETTTVMWTASSASLFSPASSLADSSAREATFITTSVANGAGTSSSNEAVQTSMGTWQAQEPAEASDGQPDTGPSTSPAKTVVLSPTMDTWSWIAVTTAMSSLALPVPPQVPTSASVPYSSVKVNETLVPISSLSQRPTEHGSKTLLSPLPSITSWMSTSQQSAPPESLFSSVLPVSLVSTSEIVDSDTLTAPSSGSDALGSTKGQPWSISTSSVLTVTYTSTVSQRASTSWRPVPDSPQQPEGPVVSTMSSSAITGGVGTVPSGPFSSGQPASLTSVSLDSSHGSPSETSSLVFASQSAWNKTTVSHSTLPFTYTSPVPPATLSTNSTAPSGKTSLAKETGSFGGSGLPASWTGAHSGMSSLVAETSSISAPYPNSTSAWWITATITSSIWPTGSSASGTTSLNGRHSTVTTTGAPVVNSANSTRLESRMSTASSLALGTESARGPFVTGSPPFPSGRNTTGNGPQALSSAWASTMTWSPRRLRLFNGLARFNTSKFDKCAVVYVEPDWGRVDGYGSEYKKIGQVHRARLQCFS
ncbi:hypothetical protein CDD81_1053 [Ophiocordyceps australis]|uniref:Uncharacterized protein n=1 Tax=Ophiocordyceps australis TaxID=1399860 RepID=A0A2C5Y100_9HYPO|nr:hypothetical protein CDD81_1053 [Ophiocordyceps australis]